ncbi:unnamed protein product, partial [marine sediment metagenome]
KIVAYSAPLIHAAGHEDSGADEISIAGLAGLPWSVFPWDRKVFYECWKNIDGWTENADGGSYTVSPLYLELATGAVINKRESLYTTAFFLPYPVAAAFDLFTAILSTTALGNSTVKLYTVQTAEQLAPLIDTEEHGGFRITNGQIYASSGDGTAE